MSTILREGTNCWAIEEVQSAGVLVDADAYYRAFHQAAQQARRYLWIAGWQFDSRVRLLRGDASMSKTGPVELLPFLDGLCHAHPELEIKILAWDFSLLYTFEREWMQEWTFNWSTCDRLVYRFDSTVPVGASHHQKFVVVDGHIGFLGGIDLCERRWDDRQHSPDNRERVDPDGVLYGPYHDLQVCVRGAVVQRLGELFATRWRDATGEELVVQPQPELEHGELQHSCPVRGRRAALSRTQCATAIPERAEVHEIERLFDAALQSAERFIYLENQYFSAHAAARSLTRRMGDDSLPKLEIVMILPERPEELKEELAIGIEQAKVLRALAAEAGKHGHRLGVYHSASGEPGGKSTYIHSKLLIVDDRFLTTGSANFTNRSLGLDTELNISWESDGSDAELEESIRLLRRSLLAEHAGVAEGSAEWEALGMQAGLVEVLERLASDPLRRLRRHSMQSVMDENQLLAALEPVSISFDPKEPPLGKIVYETISPESEGPFARGISWLSEVLRKR